MRQLPRARNFEGSPNSEIRAFFKFDDLFLVCAELLSASGPEKHYLATALNIHVSINLIFVLISSKISTTINNIIFTLQFNESIGTSTFELKQSEFVRKTNSRSKIPVLIYPNKANES